jgi:hypothetical protein
VLERRSDGDLFVWNGDVSFFRFTDWLQNGFLFFRRDDFVVVFFCLEIACHLPCLKVCMSLLGSGWESKCSCLLLPKHERKYEKYV